MVDDSKNSRRISIVTWCKCPHVSRTRIFEVSAMEGIAVRFATKLSPQCSQNTDTWLLLEGLLNKQIHNTTHARAFLGQFNCAVCIEWAVCSLQVQRWHATTQLIVFAYFVTRTKQKIMYWSGTCAEYPVNFKSFKSSKFVQNHRPQPFNC